MRTARGTLLAPLLPILLAAGAGLPAQPGPSFRLDFEAPDQVSFLPGTPARFTVRCLLATSGLPSGVKGVTAWSFGVVSSGSCRIVEATTAGTAAASTRFGGVRDGGFDETQLSSGAGNEGAVTSVLLSSPPGISLDPGRSPHAVLALTVEAVIPSGQSCVDCSLHFVDGLVGAASPVRMVVTYQGESHVPTAGTKTVRLCSVPCFAHAPIPEWPHWTIGTAVGSSRQQGTAYEICGTGAGHGGPADACLALSRTAAQGFQLSALLESVQAPGVAGLEARVFTGTGPDPAGAMIRISAHRQAAGSVQLRSSFRDQRGAPASGGSSQPVNLPLPVLLRIGEEDGLLTTAFSLDGGQTFQTHLVVDARMTALGASLYRAGLTAASGGTGATLARFHNASIRFQPQGPLPRLAKVEGGPGSIHRPTRLRLTGARLQDVGEVSVAGLPATILEKSARSITVDVPPPGRPVHGDVVVRSPAGSHVFPNSFFALGDGFIRCDCNGDGKVDISDAVKSLSFLFLGEAPCRCSQAGDCNDDRTEDISDATFGLTYLFVSTSVLPPPPFPESGFAPGRPMTCGGLEPPRVTRVSAATAKRGDRFTIEGRGFSTDPGESFVAVDHAAMTVVAATESALTVEVTDVLAAGSTELSVIRDVRPADLPPRGCVSRCPPLVVGAEDITRYVPIILETNEERTLYGSTARGGGGGLGDAVFLELDPSRYDPLDEVDVSLHLRLPAIAGLSPGSRAVRFKHRFSRSDLAFEAAVVELADRMHQALSGGGPLAELFVVPDPEGGRIRFEPAPGIKELASMEGGVIAAGFIAVTVYSAPPGRCGPDRLHPIDDERAFGWCRLQELIEPCNGFPAFEWFVPAAQALGREEDIFPLVEPQDRSPADKAILFNAAAYCHIRDHELWNQCALEDLLEAGNTAIPPFPRGAWVVKTAWRPSWELPRQLDLDRFHSYVYSGDGERYYLTALHLTTKDIDDWFWMDLYRPLQIPWDDVGAETRGIGGCGGRNSDLPGALDGTVWANYYLCTDVEHEQPLEEEARPFRASHCGNFQFDNECPDLFDLAAGGDTCMNCHDADGERSGDTVCCFSGAAFRTPAGVLDLDFLYSLNFKTQGFPDPCEEIVGEVDYDSDIQPIFTRRCTCHSGLDFESGAAGLNLCILFAPASLINQPSTQAAEPIDRVEPGDPANSFLIRKLRGTQGPNSGLRMPRRSNALADSAIDLIEKWIRDGANQ